MARGRNRHTVLAAALLVLSGAAVLPYLHPVPTTSVCRQELRASFDWDMRNVVCAWSPEDPRPDAQRRQALFEFVYQGYDSSAWVPQSVLEGNWVTRLVLGDSRTIARDRVGLVPWPENSVAAVFGMAPNPAVGQPLSWSLNCLACHMAEIDGVAYFGAGAKVLDEKELADTVKLVTSPVGRHRLARGGTEYRMAAHTHQVMKRHHHEQIDPLTRARSAAFAASHVEMYVRAQDGRMPGNDEVGRGDVKTPPLWHTAAKLPFGRWYCDGSFQARVPLMASSMELELDQSFDKLVNAVLPTIKRDFETVINHLRPPPYPYPIDRALADQGKALFYSDAIGCFRCHGVYDGQGGVDWSGLHVDVGTDPSRLEVVSAGFLDAFKHSPLAAEGRLEPSTGYAATPLTGVWANYPYLHNGSVPTLHHLLGPLTERPHLFSVKAARRFDPGRVGQVLYPDSHRARFDEAELVRRFGDDRDWFNAGRAGCGNGGHDFWSRIKTDANRRALIEYLKTL
jgi:mono/diheme cytochrome c family protein